MVSNVSEQKMIALILCWSSFETDFVLWRVCGVEDDDDRLLLVSDRDRENNLGGERESSVGERGASITRC